jgi:hypothetical protein
LVVIAGLASSDPIIKDDPSSSRFVRQVSPSASTSTVNVPVIDGATIQTMTRVIQTDDDSTKPMKTPPITTRISGLPISLPFSPHCIHNNNCAFIGLELYVIINILDPFTCGNILCAGDTQCTHWTHEPHKNGGTCTLHKAPGSTGGWSTPTARDVGCTCGHIPKRSCGVGSLLSLCLGLDLTVL